MSTIGLLWFAGFGMTFLGERLFADTAAHWGLTSLGVVGVLAAVGLRGFHMAQETDPERKAAQRNALIFGLVGVVALAMYATTLPFATDAMGLDEDGAARWYGATTSLWLIVWLLGAGPLVFLERALGADPVTLPRDAAGHAVRSGVATALALALVVPVNYLASHHGFEFDYAYFRTTRAGTATQALVKNLPEPVEATLFFAPGSDVREKAEPYFKELAEAAGGRLTYTVVDQAADPALAEAKNVRENGWVTFSSGAMTEKFRLGTELDKAKRDLKKLDQTAQKHLLKLAKGERTAYLMVGHGEASAKERDNPMRKLNEFKKVLQDQHFKVKDLGIAEGSTSAIPDDASLVIVAAPEKPLLPEELEVLLAWVKAGGALWVMAEPMPQRQLGEEPYPLDELLAGLGLQTRNLPLANATTYFSQRRGLLDRVMLITNRFGSHAATRDLQRRSTELGILAPTALALTEREGEKLGKVTSILKSMPDTWEDNNNNLSLDAGEEGKIHDLAFAIEGAEGSATRVVVIGDVTAFSDNVIKFSQGNEQLAQDTLRWLVKDEDLAGSTENEEDVKIQHSRDEDVYWFYGTIFLVPIFVLGLGFLVVTVRRRA